MMTERCVSIGNIVRPIKFGTVPPCHPKHQESADLWRTNVHIWKNVPSHCESVLILESDAKPEHGFFKKLDNLPKRDIIWLDSRIKPSMHEPSGCCCIGMLYSKRILPLLIENFTNNETGYAYNYRPRPINGGPDCLYDWFLGNLAAVKKIKSASIHMLYHKK